MQQITYIHTFHIILSPGSVHRKLSQRQSNVLSSGHHRHTNVPLIPYWVFRTLQIRYLLTYLTQRLCFEFSFHCQQNTL